jgi:hypothetical protein
MQASKNGFAITTRHWRIAVADKFVDVTGQMAST